MAEQFVKAYVVDLSELMAVVGSSDDAFFERLLTHKAAEEVASLVEDCDLGLSQVLAEIRKSRLDPSHADGYRRALELIVEEVGRPIEQWEAIMPGRGWHELGPAWKSWGFGKLASLWGGARSGNTSWPWPWVQPDANRDAEWPIAVAVPREQLSELRTELEGFNPAIVIARGVPRSIDRFGDPAHWPPDELASDLEYVVRVLMSFIDEAKGAGSDLLLWHDGSQ